MQQWFYNTVAKGMGCVWCAPLLQMGNGKQDWQKYASNLRGLGGGAGGGGLRGGGGRGGRGGGEGDGEGGGKGGGDGTTKGGGGDVGGIGTVSSERRSLLSVVARTVVPVPPALSFNGLRGSLSVSMSAHVRGACKSGVRCSIKVCTCAGPGGMKALTSD
eukprot:1155511-Pelagomonas_calceolata.AAC.4